MAKCPPTKKGQQGLKTTCTAHAKKWAKLDENCDHICQNGIKTLAKMPGNASPDFQKNLLFLPVHFKLALVQILLFRPIEPISCLVGVSGPRKQVH